MHLSNFTSNACKCVYIHISSRDGVGAHNSLVQSLLPYSPEHSRLFVPLPYAAFLLFPSTLAHLSSPFLPLSPLVHLCLLVFMRTGGVIKQNSYSNSKQRTQPNSQTYFCFLAAFI